MSDSEFTLFASRCREDLCLPADARLDDYLEFLDEFTGEVREQVRQRVVSDLTWNYHNPTMSRPRGPDPDGEEAEHIIDEAVRDELRSCARKLAKLMDGIA